MSGFINWSERRGVFVWLPPSDPAVPTPTKWKAWRETMLPSAGADMLCQVCAKKVSWFDVAPERTRASGFGRSKGAFEYRPGGQVVIECMIKRQVLLRTGEHEGRTLEVCKWIYHTLTAKVQACVECQHLAILGPIDVRSRVRGASAAS